MKFKLLFVTLSLVFVFTGPLSAEEPHDKVPPVRVLKAALDLTDKQVVGLRNIIEARAGEDKALTEQISELQALMEDLLKSEAPDPTDVGGLVLDIRVLKQKARQNHESYQQSFRKLLTSMQLERLSRINKIALADRASEALRKLRLR